MKLRIISALILAVILVPIVYFGNTVFSIAVGFLGILALKELVDLKVSHKKIPGFVFFIGMACLLFLILSDHDSYSIMFGLTYRGLAITALAMLIPTLFYKEYNTKEAFFMIGSIVFLGLALNGMILIRKFSLEKFLFLLLIPILTDTFAYIVGSLIGKHKVSKISPKKSWEGCIGGSLIGTIGATLFYINFVSNSNIIGVAVVSLVLTIVSQFGDFIFSKIKRENEIKDFSNIIPGHGGILDRFDSLIAVMLMSLILFSYI